MTMHKPNRKTRTTAQYLRRSADIPKDRTSVLKRRVKKLKLMIRPIHTPSGLLFPFEAPAARMIGRIGRTQGESKVPMPARKEKMKSITIALSQFLFHLSLVFSLRNEAKPRFIQLMDSNLR
jgi:hypothetical protein